MEAYQWQSEREHRKDWDTLPMGAVLLVCVGMGTTTDTHSCGQQSCPQWTDGWEEGDMVGACACTG